MNIAYISRFKSIDIKNWSGSEYYIADAISNKSGNQLSAITGLEEKLDFYTRLKYQTHLRLNKKYHLNRSPYVLKQYAKQAEYQLKQINADVVFSPGTMPIAYLECKQPKVFYTDATFASMINYYDWYKGLSNMTIKEGLKADKLAIENSALAIFSSDWAAQSAINDYDADPRKIKVVPLGANIDKEPEYEEIKEAIYNRSTKVCKILFLGVDWERKGGDIVLQSVVKLNEIGLKTELHIVGLDNLPEHIKQLPFVINHGFISKSSTDGVSRLENIIKLSHFLFLPSQAEAYGLVFCEAAAYGLPSISTQTGGITTIIKNNVNGITYPLSTDVDEYVKYIHDLFSDQDRYRNLALSSYNDFKIRLNWTVAGNTISDYLKKLL